MSNGSTLIVSATITSGNTYVELPNWNPLSFNAVVGGSGASVVGGALVFTATGASNLAIMINMVVASGGPINVFLGYAWDGAAVTELMSNTVNNQQMFSTTIDDEPLGTSLRLFVSTDNEAVALNWNQASVTVTQEINPSDAYFPAFTPIYPPPAVGIGGGPPPTFPPPTPPPIGTVPKGPLVGPAIAPAPVPPSVAGVVQPTFAFGSATAPLPSVGFPQFTTNSPSPPVVFSNIFTDGAVPTTPPSTATTAYITQRATPGPPIGPALPNPIPPRTFSLPLAE